MRTLRRSVPIVSIVVLLFLLASPMLASAEPAATAGGPGCSEWYTVKRGDTLYRIATRYGTTTAHLAALNGLANPNYIRTGQVLCVRVKNPPPHCGYWYQVKWGDTLTRIAQRSGVSVWQLAQANGIGWIDYIRAGSWLWIPCP